MIIKEIPKHWKNLQREDLHLAEIAQDMGYSVETKGNWNIKEYHIPLNPLKFQTLKKEIWECIINREIVWRCADLNDNRYQNHRTYKTLFKALTTEKE